MMQKIDLSSVKFVAFDYCGTIAELSPPTEEILSQFIKNEFNAILPTSLIMSEFERQTELLPYSSVKNKTAAEKKEYLIEFNRALLMGLGFGFEKGNKLYSYFRSFDRHWTAKPGVHELLMELKKRGYQPLIASNFDSDLKTHLDRDNVCTYFTELFVSAIMGVEKPAKQFYQAILDKVKCKPHEIVMVGDDINLDISPTVHLGMHAIHLKEFDVEDGVSIEKNSEDLSFLRVSKLSYLLDFLHRADNH